MKIELTRNTIRLVTQICAYFIDEMQYDQTEINSITMSVLNEVKQSCQRHHESEYPVRLVIGQEYTRDGDEFYTYLQDWTTLPLYEVVQ